MKLCNSCRRHFREDQCPFCGSEESRTLTERTTPSGNVARARMFAGAAAVTAATALLDVACNTSPPAPAYGGPPVDHHAEIAVYGGPPQEPVVPVAIDAGATVNPPTANQKDASPPSPRPTSSAKPTASVDMHTSPAAAYGAPPMMKSPTLPAPSAPKKPMN